MRWTVPALVSVVFLALDGCGGKVATDGGGSGVPSGGGTPTGGSGGAIPTGGMGGIAVGGSSGTCGANCPSYKLGGLIPMDACCANGSQCGALINKTLSDITKVPQGCSALAQPGTPNGACPDFDFVNPIDGAPAKYQACCRAQSGTCGVMVDLTKQEGPNLGCVDIGQGGAATQLCDSAPSCDGCVEAKCGSELSACVADNECMSILQCVLSCFTLACIDECAAAHPAGKAGFNTVNECVNAKCASECG